MSRRLVNPAAVLAVLLAGSAMAAPYGDYAQNQSGDWKFSVGIAPGIFSPRMHQFDYVMATCGVDLLNQAWYLLRMQDLMTQLTRLNTPETLGMIQEINQINLTEFISQMNELSEAWADFMPASEGQYVAGFPKTGLGFDMQLGMQYEFNEDLRGGINLGFDDLYSSGKVYLGDVYEAGYAMNLPLLKLGLGVQKVFHYDDMPRMNLYIGGWGNFDLLVGARFSGSVKFTGSETGVACGADLDGSGWDAGGLGGIEYMVSKYGKIYAEAGVSRCELGPIQQSNGTIGGHHVNAGGFLAGTGDPIGFDMSGIFIRIGLKTALSL